MTRATGVRHDIRPSGLARTAPFAPRSRKRAGHTSGAKVNEVERRQLKLDSVWQAMQGETAYLEQRRQIELARRERAEEALQLLDDLRRTGDNETFRNALQQWAFRPGYDSFRGFGMMTLHQ